MPVDDGTPPPAFGGSTPPTLVSLLAGYNSFWSSDGANDLHGTVLDAKTLSRDDQLTVWINQHATTFSHPRPYLPPPRARRSRSAGTETCG